MLDRCTRYLQPVSDLHAFLSETLKPFRLFPTAGRARLEKRSNHSHVRESVFEGDGNGRLAFHSRRKRLALSLILVASFKRFCAGLTTAKLAAIVDLNVSGFVWRSIERNPDFNPTGCAESFETLRRNQLGTATKDSLAAVEVKNPRRQPIDARFRIKLKQTYNT